MMRVTPRRHCARNDLSVWSTSMMDAVMLGMGLVFFALSIAYVFACGRL
jgi:hypothetical protein